MSHSSGLPHLSLLDTTAEREGVEGLLWCLPLGSEAAIRRKPEASLVSVHLLNVGDNTRLAMPVQSSSGGHAYFITVTNDTSGQVTMVCSIV